MSSAVLTALLVLQVFSVYGTSLVLNGAVGESIVLPTDEEGPIKGQGFMQWKTKNIVVIQLVRKQDSSTFETNVINEHFVGRLIMNHETGALNISSLKEEDSGEYVFDSFRSSVPLGPKIQLHVYERIVSVHVSSKVKNSTDNSSCNVILSCNVIGGSQVALSWSRNGENIAGVENRTTLTVSPTHAEEDYTCTAINPLGSLSNTVTARPCQTPERIVSVQVTSEVKKSTDSSSCNVILSCNVIGGSQVLLSWSRNGENIAGAENRTTFTVSPTHAEEDYTCTAINPIGSLSNTVTVRPCQTPEIRSFLYSYIAAEGGGLLVVMVVITLMCIRKKSKRGEVQEDTIVYAEVGNNLHTQKGSVNCQPPQPADVNTFCEVPNRTGTPAAPSTVYGMVKLDRETATQNQEVL